MIINWNLYRLYVLSFIFKFGRNLLLEFDNFHVYSQQDDSFTISRKIRFYFNLQSELNL